VDIVIIVQCAASLMKLDYGVFVVGRNECRRMDMIPWTQLLPSCFDGQPSTKCPGSLRTQTQTPPGAKQNKVLDNPSHDPFSTFWNLQCHARTVSVTGMISCL